MAANPGVSAVRQRLSAASASPQAVAGPRTVRPSVNFVLKRTAAMAFSTITGCEKGDDSTPEPFRFEAIPPRGQCRLESTVFEDVCFPK